jgi:hypothetical protein
MSYNPFSSNNNNTLTQSTTPVGQGTTTLSEGTSCSCKDSNGNTCNPSQSQSPSKWNPMNWFSGGKRRRTIKRGGSFRPYTNLGVAATASPFSGGRTAQPHNWTGGKKRRSSKRTRRFKCKKCSKRRIHKH